MTRFIAVNNTSAVGYSGWELMDTKAVPPKTFAICMPEREAKLCAALLNSNEGDVMASAEVVQLRHNNQVLTDALWKACGDDEAVVKATIESQGGLL